MRDAGTAIRKSYYNKLNGSLIINGSAVPVVDEKLHEGMNEEIYVMFSTQSDINRPNKSYFATEVNISVLVVNRKESTVQKTVIEDVSNQILQLVLPGVGTHGLTIESPFRLSYVIRDNANTGGAKLENNEFIIAKQLNFRNRITQ